MELISMAQKGRPLTREEHETAKEAGIPMPFMEGMAQITEDLSAMPAPNKASYTPQGFNHSAVLRPVSAAVSAQRRRRR